MKMVRVWAFPRYLFDKKYKRSLSTIEDWKVGRAHLPGDEDNWFSDGSKNREGAGAGVYGKNSDTSLVVPLGPHSTVLQTEMRTYSNAHAKHGIMVAAGTSASDQIVERPSQH